MFLMGFFPSKAEQPIQGMQLQEKEREKDEKLTEKLFFRKGLSHERFVPILDLKSFRSYIKGKCSILE